MANAAAAALKFGPRQSARQTFPAGPAYSLTGSGPVQSDGWPKGNVPMKKCSRLYFFLFVLAVSLTGAQSVIENSARPSGPRAGPTSSLCTDWAARSWFRHRPSAREKGCCSMSMTVTAVIPTVFSSLLSSRRRRELMTTDISRSPADLSISGTKTKRISSSSKKPPRRILTNQLFPGRISSITRASTQ